MGREEDLGDTEEEIEAIRSNYYGRSEREAVPDGSPSHPGGRGVGGAVGGKSYVKHAWQDRQSVGPVSLPPSVNISEKQPQRNAEKTDRDLRRDLEHNKDSFRRSQEAVAEPARRRYRNQFTQSSEQSSVPTTSDDEDGGGHRGRRQVEKTRMVDRWTEAGGGSWQVDDSTMESTRMVDRAKSFEYFPGESFPVQIQENSSSYEYLPGHLVTDR